MKNKFHQLAAAILVGILAPLSVASASDLFVASSPDPNFVSPPIVLQYDEATGTGVRWEDVSNPNWHDAKPSMKVGRAARYLREGLVRMTGRTPHVVSRADVSAGIVLVLLGNAPQDIRNDAEVRRALMANPTDPYAANEAFIVRSEAERVLLVANTPDGLLSAVVALLESVGYEVLGMGPNWIHVPDYTQRPLTFSINHTQRASYYIRSLHATSGQYYGVGTILADLPDPADESVVVSYERWQIGARLHGTSMPDFPGHAMQAYHAQVADHMRATGTTEGFLSPKTIITTEDDRPEAGPENQFWLWINADAQVPAYKCVYYCDGSAWLPGVYWNLDVSVPFVRQFVFEKMIKQAEASFATTPDDLVVFGMDPEDGARGFAYLDSQSAHPDWYPQYRKQEQLPFDRPYVLHGYKGLNQPAEQWDRSSASDHVFGMAGWLLHEFDKWVDAQPAAQRVTAAGVSKKELIRCSFYSYNYHDVPPTFNPDPRIRVMIADYPKHRGMDKWGQIATHEDAAAAFQIMLPNEPAGDYRILSLSYYRDYGVTGIPANRNASAEAVSADYRRAYALGFRAMSIESDFNFGRNGLLYYLTSKMMWDASLTAADLDAIRNRWFKRAFGSAWEEMKAYYDFMLIENFLANAPRGWAVAMRHIDAADKKLEGKNEPDAQQRIDDAKQYWYYRYLTLSGKFTKDSPEFKTYLWKGQMSYTMPMHMIAARDFGIKGRNGVMKAVDPELSASPAHYTHAETQAWWGDVLEHWPALPVDMFTDATLADGRSARAVDLNDLVAVEDFQNGAKDYPFTYDSFSLPPLPFMMVAQQAGDPIGFKLDWPFDAANRHYAARSVPYGVDIWNPATKSWDAWIDNTMTFIQSREVAGYRKRQEPYGTRIQVAEVNLQAPRAGTYRFEVGHGGMGADLASAAYNPTTGTYDQSVGFTFFNQATGYTQHPVYFYIPKGTRSLDLEVWDHRDGKFIQLYNGLPSDKATPTRKIDVSAMGTYNIALEPGEDGSIAAVSGNLFNFPYLYSVPTFWAKSPTVLLIPRVIAEADGLSIMK